jgi:propionyl-CoA carboxylase alpha chain
VAAGEKLTLQQKDVKLNGWAVESRVYAEDPYRNFLPSTGRLVRYQPPAEMVENGITVRNDTGVFEGGEISIWYDPMIAKLCTHAPTRAAAISAMSTALDEFVIDGIQHNIPFVAAIMEHPVWQSGKLSTGFIAEQYPEGFKGAELTEAAAGKLVQMAVLLDHIENSRKRHISGQMNGREVKFDHSRHVRLGKTWHSLQLDEAMEDLAAGCDWVPGQSVARVVIGSERLSVQVKRILNGYRLTWRGISTDAFVYSNREAELARLMPEKKLADTSKKLLCPMPGLVVAIEVKEGQEVKAGEPLAIVEAMKMENILRAERDVTVKTLNAKKGDSLQVDAVIMEFA